MKAIILIMLLPALLSCEQQRRINAAEAAKTPYQKCLERNEEVAMGVGLGIFPRALIFSNEDCSKLQGRAASDGLRPNWDAYACENKIGPCPK